MLRPFTMYHCHTRLKPCTKVWRFQKLLVHVNDRPSSLNWKGGSCIRINFNYVLKFSILKKYYLHVCSTLLINISCLNVLISGFLLRFERLLKSLRYLISRKTNKVSISHIDWAPHNQAVKISIKWLHEPISQLNKMPPNHVV